tara:strand:+ start:250 stop:717 length:468 start_codon:yes stop_codon:yes gene_type:complete
MRRELILEIIKKHPGIGFNEIARQSKLSNGVVSHYILQLVKDCEIVKSGIRAKYFVNGIPQKDIEMIVILSNSTNLKIAKILLEKSPLKSKNIVKLIGKSISTVSVSLKNLEKANMIRRKIMNEDLNLTSDIGYEIINKKLLREKISKYYLKQQK